MSRLQGFSLEPYHQLTSFEAVRPGLKLIHGSPVSSLLSHPADLGIGELPHWCEQILYNKPLYLRWCMLVTPALGRQRQEDLEFQVSLGYIESPQSKK
jgi:hypothetical protein